MEEALKWLATSKEPWSIVEDKWALTSNVRIARLRGGHFASNITNQTKNLKKADKKRDFAPMEFIIRYGEINGG